MTRVVGFAGAMVALLVAASCGGSGSDGEPPSLASPSGSGRAPVSIVALGDSDATGIGDATGRGWVGRYGDLVKRSLNRPVNVDNHAEEGKTSDQLRSDLTGDAALRRALGSADVILIGIGGADLNAGDDALNAGGCAGRRCYDPVLRTFEVNIKAIARQVRRLAARALLRAISLPNFFPGAGDAIPSFVTADLSRYQVTAERASVCQAMRANDGQCVDVVRAFNGNDANADAYASGLLTKDPCCYPSAKGQELIARLLAASGLRGLRPAP
jgi:lysophospholipase L1-like esterase